MSYELNTVRGAGELVSLAQVLLRAKGNKSDALVYAEQYKAPERVQRVLQKAAAGTTTSQNWSSLVDYQLLASGFLESLRSIGTFDRMLAEGMKRAPLRTRIAAISTAATGSQTAEGDPKVIGEVALSGSNIEPVKVTSIVVVTDDLVRFTGSAGMAMLSRELRGAVAAATDSVFISELSSGAASTASSGADIDSTTTDLRSLMLGLDVTAQSVLYLVAHPFRLKLMSLMNGTAGFAFPDLSYRGGSIAGITVLASDQIPDDRVLLVDAARLAGDSDAITLDSSQHAMLDMSGGGSPNYSLFQQNATGLKVERWFGFAAIAGAPAAVLLDDVEWGEDGSTP